MASPIGPGNRWGNFDQGIHQSANLINVINKDIATLNSSTDYMTIATIGEQLLSISEDSSYSLLGNSPAAKAFMAGLQPAVMATLANYQLSLTGTFHGTFSDNLGDMLTAAGPNSPITLTITPINTVQSVPPFLRSSPTSLNSDFVNQINECISSLSPNSLTYPNGLVITVTPGASSSDPTTVTLSGSVTALQQAGYQCTVTQTGNGTQPLSNYLNNF